MGLFCTFPCPKVWSVSGTKFTDRGKTFCQQPSPRNGKKKKKILSILPRLCENPGISGSDKSPLQSTLLAFLSPIPAPVPHVLSRCRSGWTRSGRGSGPGSRSCTSSWRSRSSFSWAGWQSWTGRSCGGRRRTSAGSQSKSPLWASRSGSWRTSASSHPGNSCR